MVMDEQIKVHKEFLEQNSNDGLGQYAHKRELLKLLQSKMNRLTNDKEKGMIGKEIKNLKEELFMFK